MARRDEDRPDPGAGVELRTSVLDLAEAVTERGIDRAERVARAQMAAEAARNVAEAARMLDPYASGQYSWLRDLAAVKMPEGMLRGTTRAEAEDRLLLRDLATQAGVPVKPGGDVPSPWGGTYARLDVLGRAPVIAPWLSEFATVVERQPKAEDLAPVPWNALPTAEIDATMPLSDSGVYELPGDAATWYESAVYVQTTHQVLNWTAAARTMEDALRLSTFKALEAHLLAQLVTGATVAADFEAAEVAAGGSWPGGGGADLVLVNTSDLPKVRRIYAAELPAADLRPRILGTGGLAAGTALVMASAGVDLRRTAFSLLVAPGPSSFLYDVAGVLDGSVELVHPGVVASVDVSALGA